MASVMQVDIGSGVLVEEGTLAALENNCPGAAAKFARGLLRIVFAPEELRGKSMLGKQCNAKKDATRKQALDPIRLQAVIGMFLSVPLPLCFCQLYHLLCHFWVVALLHKHRMSFDLNEGASIAVQNPQCSTAISMAFESFNIRSPCCVALLLSSSVSTQ